MIKSIMDPNGVPGDVSSTLTNPTILQIQQSIECLCVWNAINVLQ